MSEIRLNPRYIQKFDSEDLKDHSFFPINKDENGKLIIASVGKNKHDLEYIQSTTKLQTGLNSTIYQIDETSFNREFKLIGNGIYHRFITSERGKKITPRGEIFAVISNKGGVGKTTISIELSYQFHRMGLKTLLVDMDLGNADISNKLREYPPNTLYDFFSKTHSLNDLTIKLNWGMYFLPGESGEFKLANMTWSQKQRFFREITKISSNYDVVLLDLGAGISRDVIDFSLLADESVIVTTPKDFISGYAAGKAAFSRFVEIQAKKMDDDSDEEVIFSPWFVLNQVSNYQQGINYFKTIKTTSNNHINLQSNFKFVPGFLGSVLYDREMIDSAYNSQKILGVKYPNSEISRSVLKIANGLMRVKNELKLKNKSSGIKRFARILGLAKKDEVI
jgi:flagellar biosynthesis protein FlhG